PGRLMPSASMADAMVLAVYMPPQEPGPGMAVSSTSFTSLSVMVPRAWAPTASNTEMMSVWFLPGRMVPPYTNTDGRLSRAMPMMQPGMFLSQPPMVTRPSKPSQPATASMESAMISRDTSEYFMPSVPLAMPSEMVMVLKITPLPPAASAPRAASSARPLMCMLHGVTLLQVEAMPICGFLKSSSVKPTARSIARPGALLMPSTTSAEYLRRLSVVMACS